MIRINELSVEETIDKNKGLAFTVSRMFARKKGAFNRGMVEEDLRQEIYINWLHNIPRYDPSKAKLGTFLWMIAVTTCAKYTRIKVSSIVFEPIYKHTTNYEESELFCVDDNPLNKLLMDENSSDRKRFSDRLFATLSPEDQRVAKELFIDLIPYKEVALNRGCSKQRVSQIKYALIDKLMLQAERMGYEELCRD